MKIKSVIKNSKLQKDNRLAGSHYMLFGKPAIKLIAFLMILIFTVSGCTVDLNGTNEMGDNNSQTEDGGEDAAMEKQTEFSSFTMPPIDQNVPVNLETATLGMG